MKIEMINAFKGHLEKSLPELMKKYINCPMTEQNKNEINFILSGYASSWKTHNFIYDDEFSIMFDYTNGITITPNKINIPINLLNEFSLIHEGYYEFKIMDYSTLLIGKYSNKIKSTESYSYFYIERGDGMKIKYHINRVESFKKLVYE